MTKHSLKYIIAGVALIGITYSCQKKNEVVDVDPTVTAPDAARFVMTPTAADNYYSYAISATPAPGTTIKLPIGLTNVSSSDRKVKLTYTSRTLVNGTHFNGPVELTIPAGKAIDTLRVQGIYNGLVNGRLDTLKVKITSADGYVKAQSFQDSVMLKIQKECIAFTPNNMLGAYAKTTETYATDPPYGPYRTTISSVTPLTATTARIVVTNIYDAGWNPITFTLDWTNAAAPVVTLAAQSGIGDGATIGYPGEDVSIRAFAGQTSTFTNTTACTQTLTLKLQIGVTGLGWFPGVYTVNMIR